MSLIQTIFIIPLIVSSIVALSASSPLYIWIALEINTISFIPIIISSLKPESLRRAIKYFFIQAYASLILLISPITNISFSYLILISILIKLGAAPFHNWFPAVIINLQWPTVFIISTWQKIAPLWILLENIHLNLIFSILASLNALVGGIGGLTQREIRGLLAFSSIGHIGWLIYSFSFSNFITFIYYLSYIIHLLIITFLFSKYFVNTPKNINQISPTNKLWIRLIPLSLLSIGGLPPLLGFIPKFLIINLATLSSVVPLILIIRSYLNIYYYINIIWSTFMSNPQLTLKNYFPLKNRLFIILTSFIRLQILFCGLNIHL